MEAWWVLIPIAGIFAGLIKDWMRIRTKQQDLGTSNRELEKVVEELRQTNRILGQRVENLETIVVSQTWNAVNAPAASDAERQQRLAASVRHEVHAPAAEELNCQRAADLARRLGG
jgi:peptidoglycan hydrolase CwlO-like protein